ncbi:unnamed protein product [Urochloa humidicola]
MWSLPFSYDVADSLPPVILPQTSALPGSHLVPFIQGCHGVFDPFKEWKAKLLTEQSSAVKCPSISYYLVGTKKIQQELAKPNVLERFLNTKEDIAKLHKFCRVVELG